MDLLSEIRTDSITARKAAVGKPDGTIENVRAKTLTTLLSRLQSVMKDKQVETLDDALVTSTIKKIISDADEALKVANGAYAEKLAQEKIILETYVPTELTGDQLRQWIAEYAERAGRPLERKDTGLIVRDLNTAFPGQINGRLVSEIVGEVLASQAN